MFFFSHLTLYFILLYISLFLFSSFIFLFHYQIFFFNFFVPLSFFPFTSYAVLLPQIFTLSFIHVDFIVHSLLVTVLSFPLNSLLHVFFFVSSFPFNPYNIVCFHLSFFYLVSAISSQIPPFLLLIFFNLL